MRNERRTERSRVSKAARRVKTLAHKKHRKRTLDPAETGSTLRMREVLKILAAHQRRKNISDIFHSLNYRGEFLREKILHPRLLPATTIGVSSIGKMTNK